MRKQDEEENDNRDNKTDNKTERYLNYLSNAFVLFCIPIIIMIFNCSFQSGYFIANRIPLLYINKSDFTLVLSNKNILINGFMLGIGVLLFLATIKNVMSQSESKKANRKHPMLMVVLLILLLIGIVIFSIIKRQMVLSIVTGLELSAIFILYLFILLPKQFRKIKLKIYERKCNRTNNDVVYEKYVAQDDRDKEKTEQAKISLNKIIAAYEILYKAFFIGILLFIIIIVGQCSGVFAAANQKTFYSVKYKYDDYIIYGLYEGKYILKLNKPNTDKCTLVEISEVSELIETKIIE